MRNIIISAILMVAAHAHAAGFDCKKALRPIEKAICDDGALSQLDDRLTKAYEDMLGKISDKESLVVSQRAWLQQRDRCVDKRCLRRAYEDRLSEVNAVIGGRSAERTVAAPPPPEPAEAIRTEASRSDERSAAAPPAPRVPQSIRIERRRSEPAQIVQAPTSPPQPSSDELKPFRPAVPITDMAPRACAFSNLQLPAEFRILATGAYTGRTLSFQIDQSGHAATQFDVAVNSPDKPVVLMLGAYEPTIWNIGWTSKTRILAVLVSGYHRQAIAGLDPRVPTLNSSYDNKGTCGYFYVSSDGGLEKLNPLARKLFGKPVDLVYPAANGAAMVGEPVANMNNMVTHPASTPESFHNKSEPLAGAAGLEDGVRTGALRRATQADAQAWADAVAANTPNRDVPRVAGIGVPKPRAPSMHNGYVVLRDFTFPAGLYGAHSATFFVSKGAPPPKGNPGHSAVYDLNTLDCQGAICGAGR